MIEESTDFPSDWPAQITRPLPCPACARPILYADELDYNGGGPPPSYQLRCGNCGASGPYGHGMRRNDDDGGKNDAVRLWNKMPRRAVT